MSTVTLRFDADTASARQNVDALGQTVSKSADAVDMAKKRIAESFEVQSKKAIELGASHQKLQSMAERAASSMAGVTEQNANKIINSLDRIVAKEKATTAELANLKVPDVAEHNITNQQKASALLRGGGIRAGENFLTQFDFANKIAGIAFPVLGAAQLGKELWHGVEALKEMYDSAEKLPEAIRSGWEGLNAPLMLSVDNMRKVNDELEIAHQKFEHKPENLLALAIDDARVKADQLSASARQAATDVSKMLEANHSGFGSFVMSGAVGTKTTEDTINGWFSEIAKKQSADRDARRSGSDSEAAAKARKDDIAAFIKQKYEESGSNVNTLSSFNQNGSVTNNINDFAGARDRLGLMMDQSTQDDRNTADTLQAKRDAETRQRQEDAKAAAAKAKQAMEAAIRAQRELWQASDDQLRVAGGDTAALEAYAWQSRIDALKKGSAGYAQQLVYAQHKLAEAQVQVNKEDAETAKRAAEKANRDQMTSFGLQRDSFEVSGHRKPQEMADLAEIQTLSALPANIKAATDRWREAQAAADRYADEAQKAADKAAEMAVKNAAAEQLASVAIAEQTGQISRLDAAQQIANIHAQEYATSMAGLKKTLDEANAVDPNGASAINAKAAMDKADAERSVQVMQDASNTAAATWSGALKNANAQWVQDSQDTAKQVAQLYGQVLNGFNDNLSNLMTGEKTNWSGFFGGIGKTLANDSLKQMEGSVLGKFGIHTGKPDGSKSNPLNVSIVGGNGAAGNTGFSGLGSLLGGGGGDDGSDSGSSGIFGGLAKFAVSLFGGARAGGGGVDLGKTYLVGEKGPELFTPGTGGNITPNHQLGGQSVMYSVNVANGVTPEQMKMHVQEALRQYHPQAVAASVAAVRDHQSRRPSSSR